MQMTNSIIRVYIYVWSTEKVARFLQRRSYKHRGQNFYFVLTILTCSALKSVFGKNFRHNKISDPLAYHTSDFLFFRPHQNSLVAYPVTSLGEPVHCADELETELELTRFEWYRYSTFSIYPLFEELPLNWMPFRLAAAGFWYNHGMLQVECFYCRSVYKPHREQPPAHTRACNFRAANVGLTQVSRPVPRSDLACMMGVRPSGPDFEAQLLAASPSRRGGYQNRDARLQSFQLHLPQIDEGVSFADAGFFAIDAGNVCCYACGWRTNPDRLRMPEGASGGTTQNYALLVHAETRPTCPFVLTTKQESELPVTCPRKHYRRADCGVSLSRHQTEQGQTLDTEKRGERSASDVPSSGPPPTRGTTEPGHCQCCGDREAEVVFQPCAHLVTCLDCSRTQNTCPLPTCGLPIQRKDHIHRP